MAKKKGTTPPSRRARRNIGKMEKEYKKGVSPIRNAPKKKK